MLGSKNHWTDKLSSPGALLSTHHLEVSILVQLLHKHQESLTETFQRRNYAGFATADLTQSFVVSWFVSITNANLSLSNHHSKLHCVHHLPDMIAIHFVPANPVAPASKIAHLLFWLHWALNHVITVERTRSLLWFCQALLMLLQIKGRLSSIYRLRINGQTEQMIQILVQHHCSWYRKSVTSRNGQDQGSGAHLQTIDTIADVTTKHTPKSIILATIDSFFKD